MFLSDIIQYDKLLNGLRTISISDCVYIDLRTTDNVVLDIFNYRLSLVSIMVDFRITK